MARPFFTAKLYVDESWLIHRSRYCHAERSGSVASVISYSTCAVVPEAVSTPPDRSFEGLS